MSDSFILHEDATPDPAARPRKVAVTGAAGRIGSYFAEQSGDRYELTLLVHPDVDDSDVRAHGRVQRADLTDLDRLKELFGGQDTVVHLAAEALPSTTWEPLLRNNIAGAYNAFVAAAAAGCRRVVFASSIHAVSGYSPDRQVQADDPVSPGDLYGVSKCFGEAMERFMATQHGLSVICIRIGAFQPRERAESAENVNLMSTFISRRDLNRLIELCIDDERLRFAIFHGLSDNRFNRMNIVEARELLGYDPQDDFTELNRALADLDLRGRVRPHSDREGAETGIREEL